MSRTPLPCGSEPARDGRASGNTCFACAGLIPSRLGPTVFLRGSQPSMYPAKRITSLTFCSLTVNSPAWVSFASGKHDCLVEQYPKVHKCRFNPHPRGGSIRSHDSAPALDPSSAPTFLPEGARPSLRKSALPDHPGLLGAMALQSCAPTRWRPRRHLKPLADSRPTSIR